MTEKMKELFDHAYGRAAKTIMYSPNWRTGIDRYLNAVKSLSAPTVPIGKVYVTQGMNDMRFIFIGTRFGNVVVFEVFKTVKRKVESVFIVHIPKEIEHYLWFNGYILNEDTMLLALGDDAKINIGQLIEKITPDEEDL